MNASGTLYALACTLFVLFLLLGLLTRRLAIGRVDALALSLRGHATRLALLLTYSGRGPFITGAVIFALILFDALHKPIWIPVVIAGSQMVTQGLANFFKVYYSRVRPDYWVRGLEPGHAYPSGHATTAIVFYLGWAIVISFSPYSIGLRESLGIILVLWAIGIDWSRLALGAHYVTDVLGGTLLGFSWLCALVGVFDQLLVGR